MTAINAVRGEAAIEIGGERLRLRPSFGALVSAEAELGPLFALVERAAAGQLGIGEMAGLFWCCLDPVPAGMTRATFSEALVAGGIAAATPALKLLLTQILAGR